MKTLTLILLTSLGFAQIPSDVKHVYASWIITDVVGGLAYSKTEKIHESILIGVGTSVLCGMTKEYIWDKRLKRGTFSKVDMMDNVWGTLLGAVTLRVGIDIYERNKKKKIRKQYFD